MKMTNAEIRLAAAENGVRLWEVAETLGITDGTLSRKLRRELSPDEKRRVLAIISDLAKRGRR